MTHSQQKAETRRPGVLLVTPRPPFPPTNGGLLRIHSLVSSLREEFDFSLLTFENTSGELAHRNAAALLALEPLFSRVYTVPKCSICPARDSSPPLPGIAREWFSPEMAYRISDLTGSGDFDILHIEFIQMAFYVMYSKSAVNFLTEHDVSHVSLFNSYFREWAGLRKITQIPQWWRMLRYHRSVCRRFGDIIALTENDRMKIKSSAPGSRIHLVKTGTSLERFPFVPPETKSPKGPLVYVGHYPHYPNEDAAVWLAEEIFPLIKKGDPSASLILAGSQPTPAVEKLASGDITLTHEVPDIQPYLARGSVFVAPVRLGYGVKGKVLEAFSSGIPVVATSVVAGGIPEASDGTHFLVADSPREFAGAVLRLKSDPGLRSKLAYAGRELAEKHYSWPVLSRDMARAYKDALGAVDEKNSGR